ncbi:hypothetical protein NP233_g9063 [Leucocoprinus birnbaumii]|uniref:F-box domain-containing protein n=1 Tax=Leucocoprinus birnbaumii TaxID=56174 RepID=A0AAD5VL52_9AGAR|nr:hypothetical protein NP233_g9063 [Leucocoprinus birnbaumii]
MSDFVINPEHLDFHSKLEARQKIDSRLETLNAEIAGLSTQRNELAPIFILIPEILVKIFTLVRDACHAMVPENEPHTPMPWLRVTHVCRHWRGIALAHPALWSRLNFMDDELVDMMLSRASMTPLTVKASIGRRVWELHEAIERTIGHHTHIRHLEIKCEMAWEEPKLLQRIVLDSLACSYPLLEVAILRLTHLPQVPEMAHHAELPDMAFANSPRLCTLELQDLNINWSSSWLRIVDLNHLTLKNVNHGSTSQIRAALAHMPRLRILKLLGCLPLIEDTESGRIQDTSMVQLNSLETLRISGRLVDCGNFLGQLGYPSTCQVQAHFSEGGVEQSTITLSILANRLRNPSGVMRAIGGFSALCSESKKILTAFPTRHYLRAGPYNRLIPTSAPLIRLFFPDDTLFLRAFHHFFASFNVSEMQTMVLDSHGNALTRGRVYNCCASLPKLEVIQTGGDFQVVCDAITEPTRAVSEPRELYIPSGNSAGGAATSLKLGFHQLKILVIQRGEFGYTRYPGNWDKVASCLKTRHERQLPLKDLVFADCKRLRESRLQGVTQYLTGKVKVLGKERIIKDNPDMDQGDVVETDYTIEDEVEVEVEA